MRPGFDLVGKRDLDYLKWRFESNPYKSYQVFAVQANDSSEWIGCLIYHPQDGIAFVEDLLFKRPLPDARDLLVSFSSHCQAARLDAISLSMFVGNVWRWMRPLGDRVFSEPTPQKVLLKRAENRPLEAMSIFVIAGDCDF